MKKALYVLAALAALVCSAAAPGAAAPSANAPASTAGTPGQTRVASWRDDRKAAFLLMFDDGWPSHWQVAMPELKKRGMIGTFYIVPAKGEYKKFEKTWLTDMLAAGMVFANHTMTHNGFQGTEDSEKEIGDCTRYILENVPGKKPRLISFGLPGVKDYDYGTTNLKTLLAKNHLIDRPEFRGHGANYHLKTVDEYLALADKAIASGGLEYIVFHGLERVKENWGYQDFWAVKQDVFLPLLDALKERSDRGDLWITDHISAHKYEWERKTANVRTTLATAKKIVLELTSDVDPALYDEPLTLVTHVPATWKRCAVSQGETKSEATVENAQVRFQAVPNGGPVTLTPIDR